MSANPPTLLVAAVLAILIAAAAAPSRANPPTADERALAREVAELKAEVEALRAEVRALKARAPDLQLKRLQFALPPAPPPLTVPARPSDAMPEGTVRRQFNGAPIYIIPLTPEPPAAARPPAGRCIISLSDAAVRG